MKIDCMNTLNYFREKNRMTDGCANPCSSCPLDDVEVSGETYECSEIELTHPDVAVEIVQKWSDEHPQKTILQDFLEKHPNAPLSDGYPCDVCPKALGYRGLLCDGLPYVPVCLEHCDKRVCWNKPFTEND